MTNWNEGYVTDIDYTFGYYSELNPLKLRLAFLNASLQFPKVGTACELGFGQGLSANFHAAASVVQWLGTDFNPSHAQFAQQLTRISGAKAKLFDQSFAEFTQRTDLPDFDYIGLHGVWTWISQENREVIADFLRRKLKVGGVFYISYNTQPGRLAMLPVRDLMVGHAKAMSAHGQGSVSQVDAALDFVDKLFAVNPSYVRANPALPERLKQLKSHNRHYLAHEYFNKDWMPLSFEQTADILDHAKLNFACSAHYFDHVDNLNLTPEQQQLLNGITDPVFRETVHDFCINQQFRRDYWTKGSIKLTPLEQTEALRAQRVILMQPRNNVSFKVAGALGESMLHESVYNPILDALADHQAKPLAQIEQSILSAGINFERMVQAVMILVGASVLSPVQDEAVIAEAKKQTDKLNRYLCHKARSNGNLAYLVSPVIGGGVSVQRFPQLFLLARFQGQTEPEQWAQSAWSQLAMQKQRIVKNGTVIETDEENLAELRQQAQEFVEKQLPILIALGIAD